MEHSIIRVVAGRGLVLKRPRCFRRLKPCAYDCLRRLLAENAWVGAAAERYHRARILSASL